VGIVSLSVVSLRNHNEEHFNFSKGVTVIWGENGSGKTTILEGIHLLTYGKSFKTYKQSQLIQQGRKTAIIKGVFSKNKKKDVLAAQIEKTNQRRIKLNGKNILNRKDLIGRNNVVVLSPEEQPITKGAPLQRRQFIDKMFSISNLQYIETLQLYNRVLKQRNAILVEIREDKKKKNQLEHWNEQVSIYAENLWEKRHRKIKTFKKTFLSVIKKYDDEINLKLKYNIKTKNKNDILKALEKNEQKDIKRGRTSIGPHLDDIVLLWNDKNIRIYGSQGEHKLALFLLKVSEMLFLKEQTGSFPILLLDDLFAKIDLERSIKIVTMLNKIGVDQKTKAQTIITTTDILNVEKSGLLKDYNNTKTIKLER